MQASQLQLFVLHIMINVVVSSKPNILIMIADDLGYGDIGCFGNTTLRTPNIDKIAAQGALFTHHLTAASVCTPSRAALLTGRYPIRMGMVPTNMVRVNIFTSSISGLPSSEITYAELAKEQGYETALIGKWHLGTHSTEMGDYNMHPLNQGFDYFYGVPLTNLMDFADEETHSVITSSNPYLNQICFGVVIGMVLLMWQLHKQLFLGKRTAVSISVVTAVLTYYVWFHLTHMKMLQSFIVRNYDVIEQPIRFQGLTDRLIAEGQQFLTERHNDKKPFLLVMPWIQVHTVLHSTHFKGKSAHNGYGDEVEELDWSVGQILNHLERLGFKNNTFVYFSSDNGGHVEEVGPSGREGGYNGIFRGGKMQGGMDGGIRVPTVAMLPGLIPPNITIATPTSQMDMLPTLATMMGASLPTDRVIDGVDIMPLLQGKEDKSSPAPHEFMFHYCGDVIHSARYTPKQGDGDVWKLFYTTPNWTPGTQGCGFICGCKMGVTHHDPPLLYNIGRDPGESRLCTADDPCEPLTSAQQHNNIVKLITSATKTHVDGVDSTVTDQFSLYRMLARPWLQECCSFPACDCVEERLP